MYLTSKFAILAMFLSLTLAAQEPLVPKLPPDEQVAPNPQAPVVTTPTPVAGPQPLLPGARQTSPAGQTPVASRPSVAVPPQAPSMMPVSAPPLAPAANAYPAPQKNSEATAKASVPKTSQQGSVPASSSVVKPAAAVKASAGVVKGKAGKKGKKEVAKAPEPEPTPEPPPPPPTPEELPPVPPQVSYLNGQLTIQSTNATLSAILTMVRQATGAQIDIPAGAGNDRVATRVGPGPVRDVLVSLLAGAKFDYVILGDANNPANVQRVILTLKSGGAGSPTNMASATQPPRRTVIPEAEESSDESEATDTSAEQEQPTPMEEPAQPQETMQPNPAVAGQPNPAMGQQGQQQPQQRPMNTAPGMMQAQPGDQQGNNAGPQVKTPEQLYQELQKLQQQQQQQQQQ